MTVLFQQDWTDGEGRVRAVPHIETTNLSFIRMALFYGQKMNIKNNKFMLALNNPILARYDPHNLKDKSVELRQAIVYEASINSWYYLREILRVPFQGSKPGPLRANRAAIAMAWCFKNGINYISIQPRQTGKTIVAIALSADVIYISGRNIDMGMVTKDNKLRFSNVGRVKLTRDYLPDYFIVEDPGDTNNASELSYSLRGTRYLSYVAQSNKIAAAGVGRGESLSVIHLDEIAYIENLDETYPNLMSAHSEASGNAKKNGQACSVLMTTTVGDTRDKTAKFTYDLIQKSMSFAEPIYDLNDYEELRAVLKQNSLNNIITGVWSYLQLGYDHEWLKTRIINTNATKEQIDKDYLNIWSHGSEGFFLDADRTKKLIASKKEPLYQQIIDGYVIRWYIPRLIVESAEFRRKPLVLGCDSSEMIGGKNDFTTLDLRDPEDFSTVATFRCNEANLTSVGYFIAEIMKTFTGVVFIPERKSSGMNIIDTVCLVLRQSGISPFRRIYNKVVQEYDTDKYKNANIDDPGLIDTSGFKGSFGYVTTLTTRRTLYRNLKKAVDTIDDKINDPQLIEEIISLREKKGVITSSLVEETEGRIDHAPGGHDDTVIAMLLSCWLLFEGRNLHLYGIDTSKIKQRTYIRDSEGKTVTVDPSAMKEQLELRKRISQLESQYENTSNLMMRGIYKQQIDQLKRQVNKDIRVDLVSRSQLSAHTNDLGDDVYTRGIVTNHTPRPVITAAKLEEMLGGNRRF